MLSRNHPGVDTRSEPTVTTEKSSCENSEILCPRCSTNHNFYLCTILDRQKIWHELHCFECRINGNRTGDFIKTLSAEEAENFSEYLRKNNSEELSIRFEGGCQNKL